MTNLLKRIRLAIVSEIPVELQVCESCRVPQCTNERALGCSFRKAGEQQERSRRS